MGEFESGMMVGVFGLVVVGVIGGVGMLVVVVIWLWVFLVLCWIEWLDGC